MAIPAGYTQNTNGFWTKTSDSSGPWAWNGTAFYLISSGVAGSGTAPDYTQHPSGFWFKSSDNSGPYSYDGTNFWLAGNGGPSGTITAATIIATTAFQANAGAVFELYNTADKVTNYERLRAEAAGNVFYLRSQAGGSGTPREFFLGMSNGSIGISFRPLTTSSTQIISSPTTAASSGTQTVFSLSPTINQSGTAGYTILDINPTETATGSGTKLLQRWAVGGVAVGVVSNGGVFSVNGMGVSSAGSFGFLSSTSIGTAGFDVTIARDAADTLALRRGANAQTDRNYETYTDGSNYSRMYRSWLAGFAYFGTQAAGTGTRRPLIVQHFQTTVGALPAAATAGAGSRCHVSDALGPVFGAAVVGGGAVSVPVYSDGAVWCVG